MRKFEDEISKVNENTVIQHVLDDRIKHARVPYAILARNGSHAQP